MPVTFAVLDSGGTDTDARDYTTANDITPAANKLILAVVMVLDLGSARTASICSGCGLSWSFITGAAGNADQPGIRVFKGTGASPSTGKVTFAETVSAGQTADGAAWVIIECTNADVALASLGVIQSNTGSTATDSLSITLGAFRNAMSATVGIFGGYDNAGGALAITEGTGFSELVDFSQTAGGDTMRLQVETRADNDTGVDASISTANDRLSGIALEIGFVTLSAAGSSTPSGGLVKVVNKTVGLAGSITGASALAKVANVVLAGSVTPSGALAASLIKILDLAGSIAPTGALARQANKTLSGSATVAGALANVVDKALAGSSTPAGAITRVVDKGTAGTVQPDGSVVKNVTTALVGSITPSSALVRSVVKAFGGSSTPSGAITKVVQRNLGGSVHPSGGLASAFAKAFAGVITATGSLATTVISGAPPTADPYPYEAFARERSSAEATERGRAAAGESPGTTARERYAEHVRESASQVGVES